MLNHVLRTALQHILNYAVQYLYYSYPPLPTHLAPLAWPGSTFNSRNAPLADNLCAAMTLAHDLIDVCTAIAAIVA